MVDCYRDFLAARRELLAIAANEFIDNLLTATVAESDTPADVLEEAVPPGGVTSEDEETILLETAIGWLARRYRKTNSFTS